MTMSRSRNGVVGGVVGGAVGGFVEAVDDNGVGASFDAFPWEACVGE